MNTKEYIERAQEKHGKKYDYSILTFLGWKNAISYICPKHGIVEQKAEKHLIHGCRFCSYDNRIGKASGDGGRNQKVEEFIEKARVKHGDKYDYSLITFPMGVKIPIICKKHGVFYQTRSNHLKYDCKKCRNLYTQDEFIKKCSTIHKNKYIYSKTIYSHNKNSIIITCPKHGDFVQRASNHLDGKGCGACCVSKGEEKIKQLLSDLLISFIPQAKFSWAINPKTGYNFKYDFYIPDYNLLIEYDGLQHEKSTAFFRHNGQESELAFKNRLEKDIMKTNLAKDNGFNLVRISWRDFKRLEAVISQLLKDWAARSLT